MGRRKCVYVAPQPLYKARRRRQRRQVGGFFFDPNNPTKGSLLPSITNKFKKFRGFLRKDFS